MIIVEIFETPDVAKLQKLPANVRHFSKFWGALIDVGDGQSQVFCGQIILGKIEGRVP